MVFLFSSLNFFNQDRIAMRHHLLLTSKSDLHYFSFYGLPRTRIDRKCAELNVKKNFFLMNGRVKNKVKNFTFSNGID